MKVLISGASGFVGRALSAALKNDKHEVTALVRNEPQKGKAEILWDPIDGSFDAGALEGFDAVVHLAGENIAHGRWSDGKKKLIRSSRINGTRYLSNAIAGLSRPPQVFISASAIGYYGNRGDEKLTEKSMPGNDFLAQVCRDWEAATEMVANQGIRTVHLRIGMVLGPDGGALRKMLLPFKMGLGGMLGNGQQYMSWITCPDLVGVIQYLMREKTLKGPVNAVSPQPVRNREFTETLNKVLSRPTFLPMPPGAAKLVFGEMAEALLLSSAFVIPEQLQKSGYKYQHPTLEVGLRDLLKKS